jgi:hypothetical protein
MNSSVRSNLPWLAAVLIGAIVTSLSMADLGSSGKLKQDGNRFAIYGSAYGRLLARLSETTVDRVWHLGVEQIVPHNIDGSMHGETPLAEELEAASPNLPGQPAIEHLKDWYTGMRVAKYSRTNPYSLSESHLFTVKKEVEEMLLRSFKMDPGHYGAYNSYHLFLTTHEFGGDERSRAHAIKVANAALASIASEREDPEPWLTAASAAMNLYLLETENHMESGTDIPLHILKEYRAKIGNCLSMFEQLKERAELNGTWDNLSSARQVEIIHRYRFANRTYKQFDAMIARGEEIGSSKQEEPAVNARRNETD